MGPGSAFPRSDGPYLYQPAGVTVAGLVYAGAVKTPAVIDYATFLTAERTA
ncbi:hypothetical protein QF037_000865 [Streptomyces canus]|nr:hypothetical protein [Streptomyces canus]